MVEHQRNLILGSLITQLAINLNFLDINDNKLHVSWFMQPLDLQCQQNMRLIEQVHGVFFFCPPGPVTSGSRHIHSDSDTPTEPLDSHAPPPFSTTPSRRCIDMVVENLRQ